MRVFGVFGGTYDFCVFLAVPLPLFSTERGRKPSGDLSEDPHPIVILKTERRKGKLSVGG